MKRLFIALLFAASLRAQTIDGGGTAAASAATTATITDDTTTNATVYPVWVTANTGNLPLKVSSTKIAANPSTGAVTIGGPLTFGTSASVLNGTTGSVGLSATGTNQSITLTPSGTGAVALSGSGGTNGLLSLPAGTTSAGGFGLGTDMWLYRSASGVFNYLTSDGSTAKLTLNYNSGSGGLCFIQNNANDIYASGFGKFIVRTNNGTDAFIVDASQNQFQIGTTSVAHGSATGTATSVTQLVKSVSSIANAAATDVLTVTIPNAAHSAHLHVDLVGSLGAGGAIGANEANGAISYDFSIARTAGVATVVTASTAYGSATSSVAGASTITITAAATAMTGAVGAQQTFTIQVTISHGTGSSTNHTCQVRAMIQNANATGITIS